MNFIRIFQFFYFLRRSPPAAAPFEGGSLTLAEKIFWLRHWSLESVESIVRMSIKAALMYLTWSFCMKMQGISKRCREYNWSTGMLRLQRAKFHIKPLVRIGRSSALWHANSMPKSLHHFLLIRVRLTIRSLNRWLWCWSWCVQKLTEAVQHLDPIWRAHLY